MKRNPIQSDPYFSRKYESNLDWIWESENQTWATSVCNVNVFDDVVNVHKQPEANGATEHWYIKL